MAEQVGYDDVLAWFKSGQATPERLREVREAIDKVVPPEFEWEVAGEPRQLQVGGEIIDLVTKGPAQLEQINAFRQWLHGYLKPALDTGSAGKKLGEGQMSTAEGLDVLFSILDPEALVALGTVVVRKDPEFVREHFDLGWLVDGVMKILKYQPALMRLTQGFFFRG